MNNTISTVIMDAVVLKPRSKCLIDFFFFLGSDEAFFILSLAPQSRKKQNIYNYFMQYCKSNIFLFFKLQSARLQMFVVCLCLCEFTFYLCTRGNISQCIRNAAIFQSQGE